MEADLLARTDSDEVPEVGEWLRSEYRKAQEAERTAHSYKQWLVDFITQVAAAWVLSCVFARFLEDNELVDPPRIAGPGSRLDRARDEHTLFFQDPERAKLTNREYLLDIFHGLEKTAAGKELFGQHNPMNSLPKCCDSAEVDTAEVHSIVALYEKADGLRRRMNNLFDRADELRNSMAFPQLGFGTKRATGSCKVSLKKPFLRFVQGATLFPRRSMYGIGFG